MLTLLTFPVPLLTIYFKPVSPKSVVQREGQGSTSYGFQHDKANYSYIECGGESRQTL